MKRLIKIFLFLVVVMESISLATYLLYPLHDIVRNWRSFYRQEPYSIETLIVGSSHAYSTFNIDMFQERTGKTAYILAGTNQTVTQSYFNILEVLKYQHPDEIILEAFSIDSNDNFREWDDKDWRKQLNIDGMRFGMVKLQAVMKQYHRENWGYALLPIARCHDNWKNVEQIMQNAYFWSNGDFSPFRPSVTSMSEETMKKYEEAEKSEAEFLISETNIYYFQKLAELCRKEGITLRLVMGPMYDVYIDSINYGSWTEKIAALAEKENIPYLDCNICYDEIGLTFRDFEDFYSDVIHLNAEGARKVTDFVLKEIYEK